MKGMYGIILAGGKGTRLGDCTKAMSKQLLPVYDKPMVYYPLSTLISMEIRKIMLISTPEDIPYYHRLLGNGKQFGCDITYGIQVAPKGLAEAYLIAGDWLAGTESILILGDNLFLGCEACKLSCHHMNNPHGCTIGYTHVRDPSHYGVVTVNQETNLMINMEEKPENPRSHYAVPGIYCFDHSVVKRAKKLIPSKRGELEIANLISSYPIVNAVDLSRDAWFDCGTPDRLLEASQFVQSIQHRTGRAYGDPYVEAYKKRMITVLPPNMDGTNRRVYLDE